MNPLKEDIAQRSITKSNPKIKTINALGGKLFLSTPFDFGNSLQKHFRPPSTNIFPLRATITN